jgi:hypothetical protein
MDSNDSLKEYLISLKPPLRESSIKHTPYSISFLFFTPNTRTGCGFGQKQPAVSSSKCNKSIWDDVAWGKIIVI